MKHLIIVTGEPRWDFFQLGLHQLNYLNLDGDILFNLTDSVSDRYEWQSGKLDKYNTRKEMYGQTISADDLQYVEDSIRKYFPHATIKWNSYSADYDKFCAMQTTEGYDHKWQTAFSSYIQKLRCYVPEAADYDIITRARLDIVISQPQMKNLKVIPDQHPTPLSERIGQIPDGAMYFGRDDTFKGTKHFQHDWFFHWTGAAAKQYADAWQDGAGWLASWNAYNKDNAHEGSTKVEKMWNYYAQHAGVKMANCPHNYDIDSMRLGKTKPLITNEDQQKQYDKWLEALVPWRGTIDHLLPTWTQEDLAQINTL
tara:strand:- start:5680 stop:6615 length:936 start_codon:yes stop_codon:yes gene_type:complete